MARILLADDDSATRDFVKRALVTDGHQVVATQDGAEALDQFRAAADGFDLLVSDVQMPSLDGISLAAQVLEGGRNIGVILMSGFSGELDRADHLRSNAVRVITKPFTLDQLRAEVKAALSR
ncbi:MAG: response regulator [Hyphomicrobiaceae bacterium]